MLRAGDSVRGELVVQLAGLMAGTHSLVWAPGFPGTSPFLSFASFVRTPPHQWEDVS